MNLPTPITSFPALLSSLTEAKKQYDLQQKENRRDYLIGFLQESFKKNGYGNISISHEKVGEFIEDIKDAGFVVEAKGELDPYEDLDSTYYIISIGKSN